MPGVSGAAATAAHPAAIISTTMATRLFMEIGGQKYTPDQAKELIEAGTTYRGLKEKYPDVDFGGMVPTFIIGEKE